MLIAGCVLFAGADGTVHKWDVKDGTLNENKRRKPIHMVSPYGPGDKPPVFRALACSMNDEDFMLGSSNCDIWEASTDQQVGFYQRWYSFNETKSSPK